MKTSVYYLLWALFGVVIVAVIVVLAFSFQPQSVSARLASRAQRQEIVDQMRFHLASASDAEKSAVLATTDEDSRAFADRARAESAAVERLRTEYGALPQTEKEKVLAGDFARELSDYRKVDNELLDLAVRNTNIKAYTLAFGPAAEAADAMDAELSFVTERSLASPTPDALRVVRLATGAQHGVLRIQALLPRHIAEESPEKMDELEARMEADNRLVEKDLEDLAALFPGDRHVETALARFTQLKGLKSRILALSRENSNVRSLSISLNEKRKLTALCQDTLTALEETIREEKIAGENVVSPR